MVEIGAVSDGIGSARSVRRDLVARLWHGLDPLVNPTVSLPPDAQGWNSQHAYLAEAIDRHRPGVAVEVGVWKGASVLTMARRMRDIGCDGVVIAVDTWLGSSEHWLDPRTHAQIPRLNGLPLLYYVFLNNVIAEGLQDYVLPLPLDSGSACAVLTRLDIRPSVLHVDAAHDYQSVLADLEHWWTLLRPGGTLIADDYAAWPTVTQAVDHFVARTPHCDFAASPYKCRFSKPAG
ncbi:MAG TPA: class I SAM-dependent methyltransferase [Acetobacteraceae bacterium]|nr:class I SAM-dependent methyltransferase [Acetobacteraceae bacterium]